MGANTQAALAAAATLEARDEVENYVIISTDDTLWRTPRGKGVWTSAANARRAFAIHARSRLEDDRNHFLAALKYRLWSTRIIDDA